MVDGGLIVRSHEQPSRPRVVTEHPTCDPGLFLPVDTRPVTAMIQELAIQQTNKVVGSIQLFGKNARAGDCLADFGRGSASRGTERWA